MIAALLDKLASWALSRNAPGAYTGENDPRWAYVIETDGDAYMTRIELPRIFGVRPLLNGFHRQDIDRHLHNHPWRWAFSLLLSGSYDEVRVHPDAEDAIRLARAAGVEDASPEDFTFERRVRWWNLLRDRDYHKITRLHGRVWTLFLTGPKTGDWGFLVDGINVPWRAYLKKDKK